MSDSVERCPTIDEHGMGRCVLDAHDGPPHAWEKVDAPPGPPQQWQTSRTVPEYTEAEVEALDEYLRTHGGALLEGDREAQEAFLATGYLPPEAHRELWRGYDHACQRVIDLGTKLDAVRAVAEEYEQAVKGAPRPNYAAKIHEAVAADIRAALAE